LVARKTNNPGEETMKRTFTALVAAAALLLAGSRLGWADAPIVIKFSHVVADGTPKGRGALQFKELAEQALPGRVTIEVYPNSQLYKDKEEIEALQLGAVQMLAPSMSKFGPLGVREFEALDLPFIFKDQAGYAAVTQGDVGKALLAKLEPKGIKGLAYWDNGFEMMFANKALRTPDDFKGLKMRIQSSKVLDAQMRALGAIPQVMAFSEVYQALQTGVVDGTEGTPSNFYTQKYSDVQKFLTMSYHNHLAYAVIVNKSFWDGLPADVRAALEKAMSESTDYVNGIAKAENEDALAKIKAGGKTEIVELTAEQKALWVKAVAPSMPTWLRGSDRRRLTPLRRRPASPCQNSLTRPDLPHAGHRPGVAQRALAPQRRAPCCAASTSLKNSSSPALSAPRRCSFSCPSCIVSPRASAFFTPMRGASI
jgi:C4-dicarboxylate-binding protein DctP